MHIPREQSENVPLLAIAIQGRALHKPKRYFIPCSKDGKQAKGLALLKWVFYEATILFRQVATYSKLRLQFEVTLVASSVRGDLRLQKRRVKTERGEASM